MNTEVLSISALVLIMSVLIAWLWQRHTQNAGIIDVVWSYAVGGTAVFYAITGPGAFIPKLAVGLITGIWFARLGTHILLRVLHEEEDGRYQAIRRRYGKSVNKFHFIFFLGQALAAWLFTLPMWVIAHNPNFEFSIFILLGVAIVIIAFAGEFIADKQLAEFKANSENKGLTCRVGLWRYSRHPNYFFEWLHWFCYPLLAIGAPFGIFVWLAPVVMFFFLYFITGIPYTEQQALRSRGDDYRDYQRTTSAFIPWRPKH